MSACRCERVFFSLLFSQAISEKVQRTPKVSPPRNAGTGAINAAPKLCARTLHFTGHFIPCECLSDIFAANSRNVFIVLRIWNLITADLIMMSTGPKKGKERKTLRTSSKSLNWFIDSSLQHGRTRETSRVVWGSSLSSRVIFLSHASSQIEPAWCNHIGYLLYLPSLKSAVFIRRSVIFFARGQLPQTNSWRTVGPKSCQRLKKHRPKSSGQRR